MRFEAPGRRFESCRAHAGLRCLPDIDAEIDELLVIRAKMVAELAEEGIVVLARRIVIEEEES
jgi:hypothetical protein